MNLSCFVLRLYKIHLSLYKATDSYSKQIDKFNAVLQKKYTKYFRICSYRTGLTLAITVLEHNCSAGPQLPATTSNIYTHILDLSHKDPSGSAVG